MLIDNEADVNAAGGGNMPLHVAVEKGNIDMAMVGPLSLSDLTNERGFLAETRRCGIGDRCSER